jgi:serine/threonine-protein kinase
MQLRQFELRDVVGRGGNGVVYRAFDNMLQREVAVKLLKKELANDPGAFEGFAREARACASLNHTNIIHIYNFDESDGQHFIVMELADHGSLDGRIEKYQRVPELLVLDVGIKIASALDMALKHNLLHRDIKPGNILFNSDNEPKLVDFGLARSTEAEQDLGAVTEGTPYYVAPEKIKREPETFLSDMYSLGCTLYHGLTGHVPFDAPTVEELVSAHVHTPLTPPNQVLPEVSQATSDVLAKVLAKAPEERYLSYDEFKYALEMARSQLLIAQSTGQQPHEPDKKRTGWWRR